MDYLRDRKGKYLGFNTAFEDFFGETRKRLIGKSVFDINPPELAKIYHDKDNLLLTNGGEQHYESRVKNARGDLRDVIFNKAAFTDKGDVRGLIGAILDITERKNAEQERENLISELQKTLLEVKQLSGMLPICGHCKKIRDDKGYWSQIESYIPKHSEASFSHGICPECAKKYYPDLDIYEE